jgi:hypothetical protein
MASLSVALRQKRQPCVLGKLKPSLDWDVHLGGTYAEPLDFRSVLASSLARHLGRLELDPFVKPSPLWLPLLARSCPDLHSLNAFVPVFMSARNGWHLQEGVMFSFPPLLRQATLYLEEMYGEYSLADNSSDANPPTETPENGRGESPPDTTSVPETLADIMPPLSRETVADTLPALLRGLAALQHLEKLHLDWVDGLLRVQQLDLSPLAHAPRLVELELRLHATDVGIVDLSPLAHAPSLATLTLCGSTYTGPTAAQAEALRQMPALTDLNIEADSLLSSSREFLAQLSRTPHSLKLKKFSLFCTRWPKVGTVELLARIPTLQEVSLQCDCTDRSFSFLAQLPALERLKLMNAPRDNPTAVFPTLLLLTQLRLLWLSGQKFKSEQLSQILAAMPHLETLRVSRMNPGSLSFLSTGRLSATLTELTIWSVAIPSADEFSHIYKLQQLHTFTLENQLDDEFESYEPRVREMFQLPCAAMPNLKKVKIN